MYISKEIYDVQDTTYKETLYLRYLRPLVQLRGDRRKFLLRRDFLHLRLGGPLGMQLPTQTRSKHERNGK